MSLIYYYINFTNKQGDEVEIKITDYENYDPEGDNPITTKHLIGIAPALLIETFNTSEDKFSSIIGQRAQIIFKSTNQINFSTFATGEDYRFLVRVTTGSLIVFSGWLVMDDNQQVYLPAGQPVTLYAIDGLGSLRDIELSDFEGVRPEGKYRLIEIIAWCLAKTEGPFRSWGATLIDGFKVAFNLFEENHDNTDNCPLNQTYVDVRMFSKSLTEYENCDDVLNKILKSLGCRVAYYNNFWYILRIDEYKNSNFYLRTYSAGGTYQSEVLGVYLDKLIGENSGATNDIQFITGNTMQRLQRAYKSVALDAVHEFPEDIPKNKGFINGEFIEDYLVTLPFKIVYTIDNWTLYRGFGSTLTTPTCEAQIWKFQNVLGYVESTYGVLTCPSTIGGELNYIKSEAIPVCIRDKFNFSFDYQADGDNNIDGPKDNLIGAVALYGSDGSIWLLHPHEVGEDTDDDTHAEFPPTWLLTDADFTANGGVYAASFRNHFSSTAAADRDLSVARSKSIEAPPVPIDGELFIYFFASNQEGGDIDNLNLLFSNVSFEYLPQIAGVYAQTRAEQYKYSTSELYTKQFEEDWHLFDGPCKLYNGAMYYKDGSVYYLTTGWFDLVLNVYSSEQALTSGERFMKWQAYAAWNQLRIPTYILNSNLFGLDTASGSYASVIHKYNLHYNNAAYPLNNKDFVILSMRQDWHTCQWTATLAEVNFRADQRRGVNVLYPEVSFNFKYLEQ